MVVQNVPYIFFLAAQGPMATARAWLAASRSLGNDVIVIMELCGHGAVGGAKQPCSIAGGLIPAVRLRCHACYKEGWVYTDSY